MEEWKNKKMKKERRNVFLVICAIFIIITVVVILCATYIMKNKNVVVDNKDNTISEENVVEDDDNDNKIISNTKYVEIQVQQEVNSAEYKDSVRIEDKEILLKLENIVNEGKEDFNSVIGDTFAGISKMSFYLEDIKYVVWPIDEVHIGIDGNKIENYIVVEKYNNSTVEWRKSYNIEEKLGKYISQLYDEYEDEHLNASEIIEKYYNIATGAIWNELEYTEMDYSSEEGRAEITNYDEVINQRFTENGKKIFEKENPLLIIEGEKEYIGAGSEHTGEFILKTEFKNIKQEEDTITATVVRTMTKEAIVTMEEDELEKAETYILENPIVLKLVDGKWLIDTYSWIID